jgi:hypothetical protein
MVRARVNQVPEEKINGIKHLDAELQSLKQREKLLKK